MRAGCAVGILVLVLSILGGCATAGNRGGHREFLVPDRDEVLYGTWVNPDYRLPGAAPKVTHAPWGLVQWFAAIDAAASERVGSSIIVERWTDEKGDVWYKELRRTSPGRSAGDSSCVLDRVSGDGEVLESVTGSVAWPAPPDLDPDRNPTYVRYFRQEQPRK
jgi:hypothetical protein